MEGGEGIVGGRNRTCRGRGLVPGQPSNVFGSQLVWEKGDVIRVGGWAQNAFLLESFKRIPLASGRPFQCSSRSADASRLQVIWCRLPGCGALSNATIKFGSLQHKVPFYFDKCSSYSEVLS